MEFDVIIPARYASTRLPGKALLEIAGKPLIRWVYDCARKSSAQRIIVATDDERIKKTVERFGGEAYLTRSGHQSGSDRIAELSDRLDLPDNGVVVNVQGDEPRMPGVLIDQVARILLEDDAAIVSTACHRIHSMEELIDPSVVKVVRDKKGRAMYFSRSPIPWSRGGNAEDAHAYRHIGIYGFRASFLGKFTTWPMSKLEKTEQLEQLRILENGVTIHVCEASVSPGPGIDTPEHLERFRNLVSQNG